MQISEQGLDLIKQSEGFRDHVYNDVAGYPTIGWGHKLTPQEIASGIYANGITEIDGEAILITDVAAIESAVLRLVRVAMTQGQFDALVDFTFNLGAQALAGSTLLRDLNAGQYATAGLQLILWDHSRINGVETELPALLKRRQAELALWRGPTS